MIETIRPRMSMVKDLLPGMKESWIFNDCAIGETKSGEFIALIMVRIEDGDIFYGFIPNLKDKYGLMKTREKLDIYAESFSSCPDVFFKAITWPNIREGHRYA